MAADKMLATTLQEMEGISSSTKAAAEARAGKHPLLLYFKDNEIEAEYEQKLNEQERHSLIRLLIFPLPVVAVESMSYYFFFGMGHMVHTLAIGARAAGFAFTVMCLLLMCYVRGRLSSEKVALTWSVVVSLDLILCDPIRLAKFMGVYAEVQQDFLYDNTLPTFDPTLLLALTIVCCSTLVFVPIRSFFSWTLPATQSIAYCAATFPGFLVLPLMMTILNAALLFLLNTMVWVGCYRAEQVARDKWIENWVLRQEIKEQRQKNEVQKALLDEVTERLEALQAVEDTMKETAQDGIGRRASDDRTGQVPPPTTIVPNGSKASEPNKLLTSAMAGCVADQERLQNMARRIREADYTVDIFFKDCLQTFPELGLFHLCSATDSNSGRSMEQEYQRTIGALLSVYWLMRLDKDGKPGFCFGISHDWKVQEGAVDTAAKRETFLAGADWESMALLTASALGSSQDRVEAMLCLTAFHDIMKIAIICPTVSEEHAPFHGYPAGAIVNDHDLALAYVLEHYPDLLPSYRVLTPDCKKTVLFTQSKMNFNHGWFVQAEAPPGAMLQHLRSVLRQAEGADLSFYFLHWLTDLSGAEGRPMLGSEKFVLKFPMRVLGEFMWSIPFLQKLLDQTEVAVVEDYLRARWKRNFPDRGVPVGKSTVALLRLAVMAQGNAAHAIERFSTLPPACQEVLSLELARTGLEGIYYSSNRVYGGPSFLVYYGPALIQKCSGGDEVEKAIAYLAAVLMAGRALFPADSLSEGQTVKLEVSKLVHSGGEAKKGAAETVFALLVQNPLEAKVEAVELGKINTMNLAAERYWLLDVTCEHRPPESENSARLLTL